MNKLLSLLFFWILAGASFTTQLIASDNLKSVSTIGAGIDWNVSQRLDHAVENGKLKNLHSVIVVLDQRVVVERYYEGPDQNWGYPIGGYPIRNVVFTPDTLHDLQSITKSIVSLLYGIALSEDKVPSLESPLVNAFPEYSDLLVDSARRRIKVKHALTMTMGLEWNLEAAYGAISNSETAMWRSPDKYRYVLSRAIVAKPGTAFKYSGGATTLLGRIIRTGVNKPLPDYLEEKLFQPMSIKKYEWTRPFGSDEDAGGGLRMRPRDLAKIGQLVLNQGRWEGVQLVPSDWLTSSFAEVSQVNEKTSYGYQWWLGKLHKTNDQWIGGSGTTRWIAGEGWGDQGLVIIPEYQLVIVVNAGNYGIKGTKLISTIVLDYILPGLRNQ